MKDVKESYLDKRPYSKQFIYNNNVFKIINSNLSNAREACSNIGQGWDVLLSRFTELDVDMIDFAGKLLKDIDELPIGVKKTDMGMISMSGGWFDGFTKQNQQSFTSADEDFYKTGLVVVKPSDYAILAPQAADKIFKVVCTRKAFFSEMSKANYNFMTNSMGKLQKALEFGKKTMEVREETYEAKPQGQPIGETFVLQPTQRFIDLTNQVNKIGSETGWFSNSINTNFITNMLGKAKDMFSNSLKNVFNTQLTPRQQYNIKSAFNLIGNIYDGIGTFTGTKSTAKDDVYTGELEFMMTSMAESYKVYKIIALGLENGKEVLSQKYLVKKNGISFTTDDLKWVGNCQVTKGDEGPICKSLEFNPTLEHKRCASQILLDQELDSCDFVSTKVDSM